MKLKEARKGRGLSQAELAHFSGLTRQSINSYENGHSTPHRNNQARIARALDLRIEDLWT